jgi:hypothetical protein
LARVPDMEANDIEHFVKSIARAAGDVEAEERGRSAAGAVGLIKRGAPTPGLPRMREVWGEVLTNTIAKWLRIAGSDLAQVDGELIDQLARLDLLEYDQQREAAAAKINVRVGTLDKVVQQRREELELVEKVEFLQPVEPWPHPVVGADLLKSLCDVLDRHVVLPKNVSTAIALWVLHAHAYDAARHSPILDISSPTKRCGKTNLLCTLTQLVPKPLSAANVTPAVVFRAIDRWHPTMLIDEMDTFVAEKGELRGVINSGHTRSQAYVIRCVGDDSMPKQFSTWCPKVADRDDRRCSSPRAAAHSRWFHPAHRPPPRGWLVRA